MFERAMEQQQEKPVITKIVKVIKPNVTFTDQSALSPVKPASTGGINRLLSKDLQNFARQIPVQQKPEEKKPEQETSFVSSTTPEKFMQEISQLLSAPSVKRDSLDSTASSDVNDVSPPPLPAIPPPPPPPVFIKKATESNNTVVQPPTILSSKPVSRQSSTEEDCTDSEISSPSSGSQASFVPARKPANSVSSFQQ